MFDIGWQELFILAVIALIVVGPKDLPRAIRTITKGLRKARSMARDLQNGMDDVIREAELDDIKNSIGGGDVTQTIKDATDLDFDDFDLDADVRKEMTDAAENLKNATDPGASKKTKADKTTAAKPAKKTKAVKTTKTAKKTKTTGKTKTAKADG
jgi:sec-independent protein translocase protein TatB